MSHLYDRIGQGYTAVRREDPTIAAAVHAALGDARSVVNVGAGAGSYEPRDRDVIAVEPSPVMLAQRPVGAAPAVQASAEALPFADGSFDAVIAVRLLGHVVRWRPLEKEMARVSNRFLLLEFARATRPLLPLAQLIFAAKHRFEGTTRRVRDPNRA